MQLFAAPLSEIVQIWGRYGAEIVKKEEPLTRPSMLFCLVCMLTCMTLSGAQAAPAAKPVAKKPKQSKKLKRHQKIQRQVNALIKRLKSKNFRALLATMRYLSQYGHHAKAATPLLLQHLQHKRPEVRAGAVFALGAIGAQKALPQMVKAFRDPHLWVAGYAAFSIARLGAAAKPTLMALVFAKKPKVSLDKKAQRRDERARRMAAISLVLVGERGEKIEAVLRQGMSDKSRTIRYYSLRMVSRSGRVGDETIKAVGKLRSDSSRRVRRAALKTLRKLKRKASPSQKALLLRLLGKASASQPNTKATPKPKRAAPPRQRPASRTTSKPTSQPTSRPGGRR